MSEVFSRIDTSFGLATMLLVMITYSMWQISLKRDKNKNLILATLGLFTEINIVIVYNILLSTHASDFAVVLILTLAIFSGTYASEYIIFFIYNSCGIRKISKKKTFLLALPFIIEIFILLENLFTGSSFTISNGELIRGPLFVYHRAILVFNLAICIVIALKYKKNISKDNFRIIAFIALMLFAILALEGIVKNITILWNNIAYAIIIYYCLSHEKLAEYDTLTKALTMEYFYLWEIKELREESNKYIIALLDVDDIVSINKFIGIEEGDKVLKRIISTLYKTLTLEDKVVRLHGDKFAIIFNTKDIEKANDKLTILKQKIKNYNAISNNKYNIEYTIAMDIFDLNEINFVDIVRNLTEEIYKIKEVKEEYYIKTFTQEV